MPYQILIVDDDPYFRSEVKELLDEFDVIPTHSGEEAVKLLKKPHNIDLVILDQMLPGLTGTETLKKIHKIHPDIPTILLTGQGNKEVAVEGIRSHVTDFIEKPLDRKKINKIRNFILSSPGGEHQQNHKGIQGKIERAKHFAERNYNKKLKLEDVASEVALSPKYFSRIFKEHTGISFTDYRIKIKIEKSKELLAHGQTVEKTALQLGYQNTESFVKIFHKTTNSTPLNYRKNIQAAEGNASAANETTELVNDKKQSAEEKDRTSIAINKKEKTIKRLKRIIKEEKHFSELGRMASTVAHELRHPLGVIQTAAWNIKKKSTNNKYDSNLNSIEKMIKQCDLVINNLLDYSRIKKPVLKKIKLKDFLKESVSLAQETFQVSTPTIKINLNNIDNRSIYCDSVQIRQVIMNILKNAKEALDIKQDGRIMVNAQIQNNSLTIEISDNGKGIPKKDLNHIFDPFFTRKARGTGLGLSICKEMVKGHKGTIDVKSKVNRGTTFFINIPILDNKH